MGPACCTPGVWLIPINMMQIGHWPSFDCPCLANLDDDDAQGGRGGGSGIQEQLGYLPNHTR